VGEVDQVDVAGGARGVGAAPEPAERTVGLAMLTSSAALWAVTVQVTFLPVHLELMAVPAASIGALLSLRALVAVLVRPWMPQLPAFVVLHGLLVLGAALVLGTWSRRGGGSEAPTADRSES
jgi:hypothetical protein